MYRSECYAYIIIGTGYLWSTGATVQSITVSSAGIYTVVITDNTGCTASQSIAINSGISGGAPVISASGATTFCSGDSVTLTSTAAVNYIWINGSTTQSINVKTSGTYYVVASDNNGCTASSNAITVTVKSKPNPVITPSGPTTICFGSSVTLSSSTAAVYQWSTGATTKNITVSSAGVYTVTVTNGVGCSNNSAPVTVTTLTATTPVITPNGSTVLCNGQSVLLSSSVASSYLWSNNATTQSITVTQPGNYYVNITDGNGCTATSNSISVTSGSISGSPTISASGPTSFCSGGSVILTCSPAPAYLWSNGITNQSIAVSAAGTFTVTITEASGCHGKFVTKNDYN